MSQMIKVGFYLRCSDVLIQQIGSLLLLSARWSGGGRRQDKPQSLGRWKKRSWKIGHIFLVEWC